MQLWRHLSELKPIALLGPLAVFAISLLLGWVVRRFVRRALKAWNARTQSRAGTILAGALDRPSLIWIFMLAADLALQSSDASVSATLWTERALLVLWVVSLTLMFMKIAGQMVTQYGGQFHGALPVTTLTETLAQVTVLILGGLVLMSIFNLQITPILTALGVGGLAVALALQDTLSNLFAGFYISVSNQIRIGDYIKLNSGEEGYISDIGWRSTTIRSLGNNTIIVPNAKLSQAIVTNYFLGERRMGAGVTVMVSYDADTNQVEQILLDTALTASREVPGMLADPAPSVAFDPGFGEYGLGFTVNFQVAEFVNQFGVRNELRKRILRRFREANIEIPVPRGR